MKRFEVIEELQYLRNMICVDTETGEVTEPKTEQNCRWCEALDISINTIIKLHLIALSYSHWFNDHSDDRTLEQWIEDEINNTGKKDNYRGDNNE